jgi:MFS family permease
MATQSNPAGSAESILRASWLPMIIILLAQIQMAFNVNALPVSIGAIVEQFDTSPSSVGTALVFYSLAVAGFVMLGAKIGKLTGARLLFQVTVLAHGAAMIWMAFSQDVQSMNLAQAVAGLAAAGLVPTLVVLIAANYHGKQQAQALGLLAGTPAISGALAFFVAGYLGTALSWRYSFGILGVLSVFIFLLSFRLETVPRQPDERIDFIGAVLAAVAIFLISFGFNSLNTWGIVLAKPDAPFSLFGLSPAPVMVVVGIVIGQGFFAWSHRRQEKGKKPLIALEVLDTPKERSATLALLIISALGPAVNFLIPLYIQIVQGRTTLFTAVAVIPYTLAIATAAILIVRLYDRFTPRQIGSLGFGVVALGLTMLAYTIQNQWGTPLVILSLIVLGLGEGSLLTLVFNVLVSASPKSLAGDVGALRGVANNLSTALGTAFASVVAVGVLSLLILSSVSNNLAFDFDIQRQLSLDSVDFVSNEQLLVYLSQTDATTLQTEQAVIINIAARLRALKISFLILAGIALLAIYPARGLPDYNPGEVPTELSQPPPLGGNHKPVVQAEE